MLQPLADEPLESPGKGKTGFSWPHLEAMAEKQAAYSALRASDHHEADRWVLRPSYIDLRDVLMY
jgi:hypothetical protein